MKKISKIKISDKYIKTKWYVKLFIAVLICILIAMIAVLIKFYFDVNKESKDSIPDGNIIADFDTVKNNYIIFRSDDGLSGVKDINDRYIIEPEWNNVFFLSNGRFAVQQKVGNDLSIAVIDSDENFITPFMFKKIVSAGKDFLIAYFNEKDGFALLDTSGNIISDKIWTSFAYNEKTEIVKLTNDIGSYGYKYENNILMCTDVKFATNVNNCDVEFYSDDQELINNILSDKIYSIFNSSCIYFSALLSGNTANISSVTNEQFLDSLSANNLFKNCTVKSIKNLTIDFSEDKSEGYIFTAEIIYDYHDGDKTIENLLSFVTLNFIENEEHVIILKSMNKNEF